LLVLVVAGANVSSAREDLPVVGEPQFNPGKGRSHGADFDRAGRVPRRRPAVLGLAVTLGDLETDRVEEPNQLGVDGSRGRERKRALVETEGRPNLDQSEPLEERVSKPQRQGDAGVRELVAAGHGPLLALGDLPSNLDGPARNPRLPVVWSGRVE